MSKYNTVGIILWIMAQILYAQNSITIDRTMYQKQKFDYKTVLVFGADREGKRVWNWDHAQNYCRNLSLDGYSDWQVASKVELLKIMANYRGYNGLYVKNIYGQYLPEPDPKYFDVWMWTRNSKNSKLGGFVNFKKHKTGWADKKYKGYVICTRKVKKTSSKKVGCKGKSKQELTHSQNWVGSWDTCSGYTALKKDGSLWQFGKVGDCYWGQIMPMDPQTGKMTKPKYTYHIKPTKIGDGFKGAKVINGGYRLYAIKKDGTLWGWGEGLGAKPLLLSKSHDWSNFGIRYEGNGCCGYDVGLKKDGTLWRFSESFSCSLEKKRMKPTLYKIGKYRWKKIVLGCCAIYGLRKDGSLWKSEDIDHKDVFKRYTPKKKSYDGDTELYPYLKSNMAKVPLGTIYSPSYIKKLKVNKDGTLCLLPKIE